MSNCVCIDVDEVSTIIAREMRRARKPHRCGECGEPIAPGSLYLHERVKDDGRMSTHKTCARCVNIRDDYFECGWYYGEMVTNFKEWHDFNYTFGLPPDFAPCGKAAPADLRCIDWTPGLDDVAEGTRGVRWTDAARDAVDAVMDSDLALTHEENDRLEDLQNRQAWLMTVEQAVWLAHLYRCVRATEGDAP